LLAAIVICPFDQVKSLRDPCRNAPPPATIPALAGHSSRSEEVHGKDQRAGEKPALSVCDQTLTSQRLAMLDTFQRRTGSRWNRCSTGVIGIIDRHAADLAKRARFPADSIRFSTAPSAIIQQMAASAADDHCLGHNTSGEPSQKDLHQVGSYRWLVDCHPGYPAAAAKPATPDVAYYRLQGKLVLLHGVS
jgi:hypothetical protein